MLEFERCSTYSVGRPTRPDMECGPLIPQGLRVPSPARSPASRRALHIYRTTDASQVCTKVPACMTHYSMIFVGLPITGCRTRNINTGRLGLCLVVSLFLTHISRFKARLYSHYRLLYSLLLQYVYFAFLHIIRVGAEVGRMRWAERWHDMLGCAPRGAFGHSAPRCTTEPAQSGGST